MAKKKVPTYTVRIHSSVAINPLDWKNVFNDRIGAAEGGVRVELDDVEGPEDEAGDHAKEKILERYSNTEGHLTVEKVWQPTTSQRYIGEKRPKA